MPKMYCPECKRTLNDHEAYIMPAHGCGDERGLFLWEDGGPSGILTDGTHTRYEPNEWDDETAHCNECQNEIDWIHED